MILLENIHKNHTIFYLSSALATSQKAKNVPEEKNKGGIYLLNFPLTEILIHFLNSWSEFCIRRSILSKLLYSSIDINEL